MHHVSSHGKAKIIEIDSSKGGRQYLIIVACDSEADK